MRTLSSPLHPRSLASPSMPRTAKQSEGARRVLLTKVPEATALFWVIKILTTGIGETASDFIGNQGLILAGGLVLVTAVALVSALVAQFRATRYVAPVYWSAVTMI